MVKQVQFVARKKARRSNNIFFFLFLFSYFRFVNILLAPFFLFSLVERQKKIKKIKYIRQNGMLKVYFTLYSKSVVHLIHKRSPFFQLRYYFEFLSTGF